MWRASARKNIILSIVEVGLGFVLSLFWRQNWKWLEQEFEDSQADIVREDGQIVFHTTLGSLG